MATQKPIRLIYQAKNNATGLTDVKAQCYLNGVAKAVGGAAIVLTELDATNAPGAYELLISAATLTTWGVANNQYNCVEGYIDSVTKSAKAPFREELTVASNDDLDIKLGAPAGASVSADIAAVKTDTAAIKTDLEVGASSLANILLAIQAIQNQAGFAVPVPQQMLIPGAGSNTYNIPVVVYNDVNALIDPDSSAITVHLANQSGTSRDSYLGATAMVRDSLGQYHAIVTISSGAPEEELVFTFSYTIGGAATVRKAISETIVDVAASGLALQSTLLDVQGDVDSVEAIVTDIQTDLDETQTAVTALQADVTNNVEGSGFSQSTDSLHAIAAYLLTNVYSGGRAV